jgi:hypothetical protein
VKSFVVCARRLVAATILFSAIALGQKGEYGFYTEFRNSFTPQRRAENPSLSLTDETIVEKYAEKLRSEPVPEIEIAHRTLG